MKMIVFRMLPFAGITQIRFKGISHPANTEKARTPSVCRKPSERRLLKTAIGELYALQR